MKTSEILREAKALIDSPEKWCRYDYVDSNGCMCTFGAINMVLEGDPRDDVGVDHPAGLALQFASAVLYSKNAVSVNDTHTHADVMAMYDRAIAAAEAAEGGA